MDELIPMVLGGLVLMIPIIAILTSHQQKMAKLFREDQGRSNTHTNETGQLRAEISDLKHRIDSLTLSIEQMRDEQRNNREIERRINI